jgi:hypothetical protein
MKLALLTLLLALACQSLFGKETNLTLTVEGVTYTNVVFGTATPYAVSIRHDAGVASIPLNKLPAKLQKRFGYDPKEAAQYRSAELQAAENNRQAQAETASRLSIQQQQEQVQVQEKASATAELNRTAVRISGKVIMTVSAGTIVRTQIAISRAMDNYNAVTHRPEVDTVNRPEIRILLVGPAKLIISGNDKYVDCNASLDGTFTFDGKTLERYIWVSDK